MKFHSNSQKKSDSIAHALALFTILVWGTTFISTKVLLSDFSPVEILFFRFVLGFAALFVAAPHRMKKTDRKQEFFFALAGLCGICLYYLLENISLTYTSTSNVSVIISIAPFFTAMLSRFFFKDSQKLGRNFFLGFAFAIFGIFLINYNGAAMKLNPLGDLLALLAAIAWACYSNLVKKISSFGHPTLLATRRIFGYGLLFMCPSLFFFDFRFDLSAILKPVSLFNLLFLGLCASALCFVTWNHAVRSIGAVSSSIYIYLTPVITVVASVLILDEKVTPLGITGILFTLAGLFLSQAKSTFSFRKKTFTASRSPRL